jgi:hypothetical protein
MDTFTSLSRDNCVRAIKLSKKWLKVQSVWVLFNLSITCFDWQTMINNHSFHDGILFGIMLVTSLWSIILLLESWAEFRNEKYKLKFLTELNEIELSCNERQEYVTAKEHYERLIENIKRTK